MKQNRGKEIYILFIMGVISVSIGTIIAAVNLLIT